MSYCCKALISCNKFSTILQRWYKNINHAGQKGEVSLQLTWRCRGMRQEWQNTLKMETKVHWEGFFLFVFLKYLRGSLPPSQPHHCLLLPALVSKAVSPAHLERGRWFGEFHTTGEQRVKPEEKFNMSSTSDGAEATGRL